MQASAREAVATTNLREPRIGVVHSIAGIYAEHGGTSRSVPALCDALAAIADITLVTAAPAEKQIRARLPTRAGVHVVPEPRQWGRVIGMPRFALDLNQIIQGSGAMLLHDHGMWLPSNVAAAWICAHRRLPRIVSPRGMLSAWSVAHRGVRKRVAWLAYQQRALASAIAFHATSDKEAMEIRAKGFRQPIAVIPNGVCVPPVSARRAGSASARTALFLSRLHPKKGVIELLEAWAQLRPQGWKLQLAGPAESEFLREVRYAIERFGLAQIVELTGELDDERKWDAYAQAALFVLPSWDENYGIVVAEAMAAGLPVITTTATPWSVLAQLKAGWVVAPGVDGARKALSAATMLASEELASMGACGRVWAESALGWPAVAQRMFTFYEWLLAGQPAPPPAGVWT